MGQGNDRGPGMARTREKATMAAIAGCAVMGLAGCGGGGPSAHPASSTASSRTNAARAHNQQVIAQASSASDNQSQLGAAKIQAILTRKLGLDSQENFNLNHHITQADTAEDTGDCYVKLGADAVNYEDQTANILYSPDEKDVVFVQSDTATPLVSCLKQVKSALGW